ncbi:MAG: hypothetical protein ABEJ57_05170 [Halobacteriaceae archaeon]
MAETGHIGITVEAGHPFFSEIGDRLAERGHTVSFLDPETVVPRSTLAELSLFVSKRTRPASIASLRSAADLGVTTWNSPTGVIAAATRFSQLCLLEGVGFDVPAAGRTKPAGEYVAKGRYHWSGPPERGGEGDIYEELLAADPIDFKYYVVDTGDDYEAAVVRATSKPWDEKRIVGTTDPDPTIVDRITTLLSHLDMRGIGVDVLHTPDGWYAVDLNPCPSFVGTDLERAVLTSIEDCLATVSP